MKHRNLTGVWIGLATALTAVSAFIRIPIQPVPFTLQDFIVFLIPVIFGPTVSFFGILLYLCLGLIGLPIFASGGGIGYVLMPTFGYILGFLLASVPVGVISQKMKSFKGYLLGGIVFIIIVFTVGFLWLYLSINFFQHREMSLKTAFFVGVVPYLTIDILKIIVASLIAPSLKKIFLGVRVKTGDIKVAINKNSN